MTVQSYRRSLQEFSEGPVMARCKRLSSSHLLTGVPQSITEWLVFWEKDPVEILLDLGFGREEPDVCTKIPARFLSGASVAKGINIRVFLEAQKQRMDVERPNLYERFRQLEVLDHVTNALSSLLTNVNTQQTKTQDTGRDETILLDSVKSRPVVTRGKRRRIGQLLKRASRQTVKQDSLAPGEANLPSRKEKPCSCADGTAQMDFSACVTSGCLTQELTSRHKSTSAYPTSQHPPTPVGEAWASQHPLANQPHLSPACEVPTKDRPRKQTPLLVAHTIKKVADLNCKLPDSFEMEEVQSFEDEMLFGNAPDTTSAEVRVTRTSSCQSDSSGFMEELPEPAVLQNTSLSGKIDFIPDIHNQEAALSHKTVFPLLHQDSQQKPDDCVAKVFITACESILTVSRPRRACSDQGEGIQLLLVADNGKYQPWDAEPQSFVQEILYDTDKKEDKTERKQVEKERCIQEHSPFLQGDTWDEGDPSSSKTGCHLYFSTGHKKLSVTSAEQSGANASVFSESKIRGEEEGERCWTEKDIGISCHESAHGGCTGLWWDGEVVSKDGTWLAVDEVTNRPKFCQMDGDSTSTRWPSKRGLTENPQWSSSVQSGSKAASNCSLQVSQRHPSCLVEESGLSSYEDQERKMLGANKPEQRDPVQNTEMASVPLKSVTVQMSSGLEFTSKAKGTGQNAPLSESLTRAEPVDYDMLAHSSEGAPLIWSDPGALKRGVKQTTKASSQTASPSRKPRWLPLLRPSHTPMKKSASLDSMLCGKYRSHCWGEASSAGDVQGRHCCHCCCCHGCCPWTLPMAVSPQSSNGELQLLETLMLLQDTARCHLAPCTLHEIEAMKTSCQHFQERLDEIEQHLTKQQALFSTAKSDEGREEGRYLQLLRRAVRQEVAELEFQLNNRACQVKESILMQLDQLLAEQSHLFSELGLSDWKAESKAQSKQAFTDAADTAHPPSRCSKMVLQRAPSKGRTQTGSCFTPGLRAPQRHFPTRITPELNSADSAPQELSTNKKEIKGSPQVKLDFEALTHNMKKSFNNS